VSARGTLRGRSKVRSAGLMGFVEYLYILGHVIIPSNRLCSSKVLDPLTGVDLRQSSIKSQEAARESRHDVAFVAFNIHPHFAVFRRSCIHLSSVRLFNCAIT